MCAIGLIGDGGARDAGYQMRQRARRADGRSCIYNGNCCFIRSAPAEACGGCRSHGFRDFSWRESRLHFESRLLLRGGCTQHDRTSNQSPPLRSMDSQSPLFIRVDGPEGADPVILLHGGPGASHDYLYPQMLFLAERHRVIAYDQRGGGQSRTGESAPVTWRTHVDDLAMIAEQFGIAAPTIVGYSWGGLLALLYAIHASELNAPVPSRLVLVSPAPITREWRAEFEKTLAERSRSERITEMRSSLGESGLRESDPAAFRQRSFELSVAGYFADPEKAVELTPFRVIQKVQQSVWESLGDYDLRDSLQHLSIPSLVLHGRHDPIPIASSEALAQLLGARLVVLEHSGHVPYVEQLAALSTAVEEFLDVTATPAQ